MAETSEIPEECSITDEEAERILVKYGFRYGRDARDNVRVGWAIRNAEAADEAEQCDRRALLIARDEWQRRAECARREERERLVKRLRDLAKAEAARDPHAFGDSGHRLQARESLIIACATTLTMAADLIERETP